MPLIIAATDFSTIGENAVNYACNLARAQNSDLVVVHTFILPVMFTDIAVPNNLANETQNDSASQMKQLIKDLRERYPGLTVNGKVLYGDIIDALEAYTKENINPWLVVIGNNPEGTVTIDSTLMETFKESRYPVLAIPPLTTFKPVKKVCFAFDNKYAGSDLALLQLRDLQHQLHAELEVLNAQADVMNRDNTPDIDEATKTVLARANPQYHFRYGVSIEDAIKAFIAEENIDWLIVMPRKHSFFESIFHKSHAKAMAHNASIPILALHENI